MPDRATCKIRGCNREPSENGYCSECLNDMGHGALDIAGVR